jgi:putative transposase
VNSQYDDLAVKKIEIKVDDRDHNAAKVILAAGRAERLNAFHDSGRDRANGSGGAHVSPPTTREAKGDEAGSTPTAA